MRLLVAGLICCLLLGGMAAYMQATAKQPAAALADEPATASAVYSLEITPSFRVGDKDPFALDLDDGTKRPSLSVELAGKRLYSTTDTLEAGKPILIEPIEGLKLGQNRLLIKATVSAEQSARANALRVVVRQGDRVAVDETIWASAGESLSGEVLVDTTASKHAEAAHDHD
ncbi:MAG: hypothetical protein MI757_11370 [Pirellulales bacterium]|nr:hypothetical protein [Pirellulales bacterium]